MGNFQSTQNQQREWTTFYEILQDNLHDDILLIKSKKDEQEYLGKVINFNDSIEIQTFERCLKLKSITNCAFISHLVEYRSYFDNLYCNKHAKYLLVFEKEAFSVRDESYNRKFRFQKYQENEILCILQSVVKGLMYLKQIQQPHKRICSQNVFIRQDRSTFLSDPWLYPQQQTSIYNMNTTGYIYPSPQKIQFQNDIIFSYDYHLSDYFSLGIMLLELVILEPMDFIYEKGFRKVHQSKIMNEIQKLKSNELKNKIKILTYHNPIKRSQIERFFEKEQNLKSFVRNERNQFKNKLMRNDKNTVKKEQGSKINISNPVLANMMRNQYQYQHTHILAPALQNRVNNIIVYNKPKIVFNLRQPEKIQSIKNQPILKLQQNNQNNGNILPKTNYIKQQEKGKTQQFIQSEALKDQQSSIKLQQIKEDKIDNSHNDLNMSLVKNSLEEQFDNKSNKQQMYKQLTQLNNLMKEVQSLNVSQEKSPNMSEVIGHGFSVKYSQSIGLNSKHQLEGQMVRNSMPQPSNKQSISNHREGSEQIVKNQRVSSSSDLSILNTIIQQTKSKVCQSTPNKRPIKKRNQSTIKEVSQESPSIQSHSMQLQERTIEYDIGTKYTGQIQNGKRNGRGIFYFQDGSYYEGYWKDNKMHGKGFLYYDNGKLAYDGNWYMDSFHGKGNIYNDTPNPLHAQFNYHNMNFVQDSWQVYNGDFFNDKKNGKGKLKLSNGEVYVGQYMDNKVHGQGKFYRLNGHVIHGRWIEGILVKQYS